MAVGRVVCPSHVRRFLFPHEARRWALAVLLVAASLGLAPRLALADSSEFVVVNDQIVTYPNSNDVGTGYIVVANSRFNAAALALGYEPVQLSDVRDGLSSGSFNTFACKFNRYTNARDVPSWASGGGGDVGGVPVSGAWEIGLINTYGAVWCGDATSSLVSAARSQVQSALAGDSQSGNSQEPNSGNSFSGRDGNDNGNTGNGNGSGSVEPVSLTSNGYKLNAGTGQYAYVVRSGGRYSVQSWYGVEEGDVYVNAELADPYEYVTMLYALYGSDATSRGLWFEGACYLFCSHGPFSWVVDGSGISVTSLGDDAVYYKAMSSSSRLADGRFFVQCPSSGSVSNASLDSEGSGYSRTVAQLWPSAPPLPLCGYHYLNLRPLSSGGYGDAGTGESSGSEGGGTTNNNTTNNNYTTNNQYTTTYNSTDYDYDTTNITNNTTTTTNNTTQTTVNDTTNNTSYTYNTTTNATESTDLSAITQRLDIIIRLDSAIGKDLQKLDADLRVIGDELDSQLIDLNDTLEDLGDFLGIRWDSLLSWLERIYTRLGVMLDSLNYLDSDLTVGFNRVVSAIDGLDVGAAEPDFSYFDELASDVASLASAADSILDALDAWPAHPSLSSIEETLSDILDALDGGVTSSPSEVDLSYFDGLLANVSDMRSTLGVVVARLDSILLEIQRLGTSRYVRPEYPRRPAQDDLREKLNFDSLDNALHELMGKFPFAAINDFVLILAALTRPAVTPVFDLPVPNPSDWSTPYLLHVDLSDWDGVAAVMRTGITLWAIARVSRKTVNMWANREGV